MKNGTSANAVNGYPVNQVGISAIKTGAYGAGKEAKGAWFNGRVSKPSNVNAEPAGLCHWQQCYRRLWELKLSFEAEHNR